MGWEIIAQLIITVGLPAAQAIWAKWQSGKVPTLEDFTELRAMISQTANDRLRAGLIKAGIALDSEQAKILLAMA